MKKEVPQRQNPDLEAGREYLLTLMRLDAHPKVIAAAARVLARYENPGQGETQKPKR